MNPDQLQLFKNTPGAMSVTEGLALSWLASLAPQGTCAESGTHSGKSAIAIASGLNRAQQLFLIDPDFKAPEESIANGVMKACPSVVPSLCHGVSGEWLPDLTRLPGGFAFVFLDSGDHTYELCRAECDIVCPRLISRGILAFHDLDSQFVGVRQCYDEVLAGGGFEEVKIDWPAFIAAADETGNNSYHHPELAHPTFLGALRKL